MVLHLQTMVHIEEQYHISTAAQPLCALSHHRPYDSLPNTKCKTTSETVS